MILGFKTKFPKSLGNKPTDFIRKIKAGEKIHTFRPDRYKRWKQGRSIQFYNGAYRQKERKQFWLNTCKAVEETRLENIKGQIWWSINYMNFQPLTDEGLAALAKNDGFDNVEDFIKYFVPNNGDEWSGRIIHWTDKRYA